MCVRFRCVCARLSARKTSHIAWLFRQQFWAFHMLALCLRAVLISSPDTWDWTRMHALAVMHRRTLCENVDSAKIKVPFYKYRYFKRGIDASYRHILYRYIDPYRWIVTSLVLTMLLLYNHYCGKWREEAQSWSWESKGSWSDSGWSLWSLVRCSLTSSGIIGENLEMLNWQMEVSKSIE